MLKLHHQPSPPLPSTELLIKLLIPLKLSIVWPDVEIAPPRSAELLIKLLIPLKLSTIWPDVKIAPPPTTSRNAEHDALLSMKAVLPVNVMLLSRAAIAPPPAVRMLPQSM